LTEREREVFGLIAEGLANEIGERMYLSPKTVEAHISQIFMKLTCDRHRTSTAACWRC
jgi:DNA-binding NarL/FixJ family response regulator